MLCDDKVSHRSHVGIRAVKKHRGAGVKENHERVPKEIARVLATEMTQEQEIDRKVTVKSRPIRGTSLKAMLNEMCSIQRRSRK